MIWARSLRCLASSTGVSIAASVALTRSRRLRASSSTSCTSSGYGVGRRSPACGPNASRSCSASSRSGPIVAGSSRIRRTTLANRTKRPGASWTPTVSLITSSSTWASSKTTRSCSGRIMPPLATSSPYRWVLTTTTSATAARRRACSAKHGSPSGQRSAPGHSSLPTLTDRHVASVGAHSSSAASPVVGVADPLGDLGDLGLRGRRHALQLELGAVAAAAPARAGVAGRRSCCGPSAPPSRTRRAWSRSRNGRSFVASWSCRALVAVATTTRTPDSMAGTR